MNPATDSETPHRADKAATNHVEDAPFPSNWREALLNLVASRSALIQLELKEAAGRSAKSAALTIAAIICAFFTWALLLAGGIAAMSIATGWPWYWISLAASGLHLLAAIVLVRIVKTSSQPAFPVTRSEFQKDREWIENLQKTRKSND